MIVDAMPNARKHALRKRGGLDTDDAIGIAYLTLVEIAPRYDPRRNVTFWQFARQRITGALKDAMRKLSTTKRRPGAVEAEMFAIGAPVPWLQEDVLDVQDPRNFENRFIAHVCVARAVGATKPSANRAGMTGRRYAIACLMAAGWNGEDIYSVMPMSYGLMGVTRHGAMTKMRQELGA